MAYFRCILLLRALTLSGAIEHPEKLAAMRPACRELYESHYSKQAFSDSLQQAVRELTGE